MMMTNGILDYHTINCQWVSLLLTHLGHEKINEEHQKAWPPHITEEKKLEQVRQQCKVHLSSTISWLTFYQWLQPLILKALVSCLFAIKDYIYEA